jgi:hypothetical protein
MVLKKWKQYCGGPIRVPQKIEKISCFEELHVLFGELEAFPGEIYSIAILIKK